MDGSCQVTNCSDPENTAGPPWPHAAVFDCDGLLADTAACWHGAYADVARAAGRDLAAIDLDALNGASVAGAAARLRDELGVEVDEETLRQALSASFADHAPEALPGVRRLVGALRGRIPIGVATNGPRRIVEELLERLSLRDAFATVVSSEETERAKPAPDVYLEACRRLGAHPSDTIAFEDSALGAEAARAAGLLVVGIPSTDGLLGAHVVADRIDDHRILSALGLR